jgi:two-component system sensor histidine kinase CpxA
MTGAAGQMARGQFETRVDTNRNDELGRLGESLNHMAGRLGEYVTGQKRFLGDIAHELCSPLARMEMALGVLEQQAGEKQQGYVTDVREEVRHMSSLVNELLSFSKAGMQGSATVREPVVLRPLLEAAVAREAAETGVTLNVPPDLTVLASPSLLTRAVGNVLRNAVHHAGPSGPVEITATRAAAAAGGSATGEVVLAIADHGPGVPAEALPKLFDPFFRVDTARTRETGGVGLGLAIVKSCLEACGGSVTARARPDGTHGLVVELRLPAATQA